MLQPVAPSSTKLGIIGLGYVGLPLALTAGESGLTVLGFDADPAKIIDLKAGRSYIRHIGPERVASQVAQGRLAATTDLARIRECGTVILCLPTPLDAHLQPDLSYIEQTCRDIAPHLAADSLVILESTTWPGTTDEVVRPLLEAHGRRLGVDLFLAYSPEREDPGNGRFTTRTIPKLVGGCDGPSAERALALYRHFIDTVIPVVDARTAEAAKLLENVFRGVNIALVNELKTILDRMGIDVFAVIRAAATKPFGFMPFYPGPGLGGHCIPLDPYYLSWKAREFGLPARFIELAGEINRSMPAWVVAKVQDALNDQGKAVKGSRILLLGVAYKANVDDQRESPSLELMHLLEAKGASVSFHDPHLAVILPNREYGAFAGRASVPLGPGYDLFLLATAHQAVTPAAILAQGVPVVDTRGYLPPGPLVIPA